MEFYAEKLRNLNNIKIESDTVCLRELRNDDCAELAKMVRNYSVGATIVLYGHYQKTPDAVRSSIDKNQTALRELLLKFDEMKPAYPLSYDIQSEDGKKQIGKIWDYVDGTENFKDGELFSPYGPIQVPFKDSVEKYIGEAISAREEPVRKMFRLGILWREELVGCFVFNFYERIIDGYHCTGDIGIFLNAPGKYRNITEKNEVTGKVWREAFFVASAFIQRVFPYPENIHISVTTHPLNYETHTILCPQNGFVDLGITGSKYGKRRCFIIPYGDFLKTFLQKEASEKMYRVHTSCVKCSSVLLDTKNREEK